MITIRQATNADLHLLRDIGNETYREHFSAIWSPAAMQDYVDRDFSPDALALSLDSPGRHTWLLALDGSGKAAGFAKLNWSRPTPVIGTVGAELQKIYFLKSEAGRGYGKQLLNAVRELATRRAEPLLWLDVLKTNVNAQRFYQAFGFRKIGEIPFKTDLADIGMYVMACELKAGA